MANPYTATFSHEFEAGPSGAARSYWLIQGPGAPSHATPVCLHHTAEGNPQMTMDGIVHMLGVAFARGEQQRAADISDLLGGITNGRRV